MDTVGRHICAGTVHERHAFGCGGEAFLNGGDPFSVHAGIHHSRCGAALQGAATLVNSLQLHACMQLMRAIMAT